MSGNSKLNMAFVANLFNSYPGLPPMDAEEVDLEEAREETREEKSELTNLKLQTLALLMNVFHLQALIYIVLNRRYTAHMLWVKIKFCVNLFYLG